MQEQTPLEQAAWLTEVTGNNFLLKREDLQPVRLREMETLVTTRCVIPRHGQYIIHYLCSWHYKLEINCWADLWCKGTVVLSSSQSAVNMICTKGHAFHLIEVPASCVHLNSVLPNSKNCWSRIACFASLVQLLCWHCFPQHTMPFIALKLTKKMTVATRIVA